MHPNLCRWLWLPMLLSVAASGDERPLPAAVDLRPQFDALGLDRSRQGDRPTCSAFTIAGALEFAVGKCQGHTPRLSVEFLNWASNDACNDREDGGFFSDLWKGYERYGICAAADWAYAPRFAAGQRPPVEAVADAKTRLNLGLQFHWIKEWDVNTGLTPAHLEAIRHKLSEGWPVCGGFRWPKAEQWVDGVLQMAATNAVRDGHSVLLVGYRTEEALPGGGAFLFRNSSHNGEDGWMPYAYAQAYMNDAAWIAGPVRNAPSAAAPTAAGTTDFWRGLFTPLPGRNRRVSSNEQPLWNDANLDMTILPPGKAVEMPLLQGPGVITHVWMTSHAGRVNELNALTLRIYWDGRAEPGVEAPLGEFFAVGQGQPATVESLPVQVSPSGALSCYWRMPFRQSARLVVSNDNPDRTAGLYWQVDWTEVDALPPETPYFHASYRQEYPAVAGRDYLLADLEGQGAYVGTVLSVTLGQDGWWGEGDDFFQIDGEAVPSLQGTGAEDYFNDAWGFRVRSGPWFGQPRWQGDEAGDSGVGYRWHLLDPVNFTRSLKVSIEHKGNRMEDLEGFYLERPDFLNSVAFWYQTGEPKPWPRLQDYSGRRVPWMNLHLVPLLRHMTAGGGAKPQVEFGGMFGARPVVAWTNTQADARLEVPFTVGVTGRCAVRLTVGTAPHYGRYDIELDGRTVRSGVDFRSRDFDEMDLSFGTQNLAEGEHRLAFKALPVDGGPARGLALELLRVLRLPPEAVREVKNHNEAHFIRLGIGRAIYAYRLAYGELPASLEVCVQAGLLPVRYLADENNQPLSARREGDALVVESPGPKGWTHQWRGLDARR